MSMLERLGLSALQRLDPERAHDLALAALASGLAPSPGQITSKRLATRVFGLPFPNPVGTAAGFDKNARAIGQTLATGFGFVEVGAVTPRPQPGNPRPRLFRLPEDQGVINRFGFNNDGLAAMRTRLLAARGLGLIGVNLGANKDSEDRAQDYVLGLQGLYGLADFFTVNISSPNTERLRDLQGPEALTALIRRIREAAGALAETRPGTPRPAILLKIAPDLSEAELAAIAAIALGEGLDGIIATNTTLARDGLASRHAAEAGGLSGAPLKTRALQVLRRLRKETGGQLPLIGTGGIATAEDAYTRLKAGASLVQLYSALTYHGISLGARIARDLDRRLQNDGCTHISDIQDPRPTN